MIISENHIKKFESIDKYTVVSVPLERVQDPRICMSDQIWCRHNIKEYNNIFRWKRVNNNYYFLDPNDAMMFKLSRT